MIATHADGLSEADRREREAMPIHDFADMDEAERARPQFQESAPYRKPTTGKRTMFVMPKEARNLKFQRIDHNYCDVLYNGSYVGSVLGQDDEYVAHAGPAGVRFRETCKANLKRSFILFLEQSGYIATGD